MPELELTPRKLEPWFGVLMTQNSKDQDTFSGEPFPGVRLIETLYVRNPLAQGKRRREDWFAEIYVTLPAGCFGVKDNEVKGCGFDSDRAGARAVALSNLSQQIQPMIRNLELLGLLNPANS
jgi:hypothetical protein